MDWPISFDSRLLSEVNKQHPEAEEDEESHDAAGEVVRHPVKAYSVIKNFMQTYKEMGSVDKVSANYKGKFSMTSLLLKITISNSILYSNLSFHHL